MTHVGEFSTAGAGSAASGVLTVPAGGVSVGETLFVGVASIAPGTVSATDDAGNTYTLDQSRTITSATSHIALLHTVVTSALAENDEITVAFGATVTRWAIQAQYFDDEVTSVDTGDWGDNGGAGTTALDMGDPASDDTSGLYVVAVNMLNVGRTFTPGAGWTAGTKVQSTVGTGDRAIQMMWRTGTGAQSATATFNTSGSFVGASQGYGLDAGPSTTPLVAMVGGVPKQVASTKAIIGGVEKDIAGIYRIVSGSKVPLG